MVVCARASFGAGGLMFFMKLFPPHSIAHCFTTAQVRRTERYTCSFIVEWLSQPDEQSFRPPDVTEAVRVLVPNYFADELRTALTKPGEHVFDIFYSEHNAQVAEGVYRGLAVIGGHRRAEKS